MAVNKDEVYTYMKAQYDEITNMGDNYDPDVHDPMVAELASKKFGITSDEAGKIYEDKEMEIAKNY